MLAHHAPALRSPAHSANTTNAGLPGPSVPGHVPAAHSLSLSQSSASSPQFQFQFQSPTQSTSPPAAAWNPGSPGRATAHVPAPSPPISVIPAKRPAPVDDDDDLLDNDDPNSTQQARRRSLTTPYQNYILRAIISIVRIALLFRHSTSTAACRLIRALYLFNYTTDALSLYSPPRQRRKSHWSHW